MLFIMRQQMFWKKKLILKKFLTLSFAKVWRGVCRPSWVDPMADIYWKRK